MLNHVHVRILLHDLTENRHNVETSALCAKYLNKGGICGYKHLFHAGFSFYYNDTILLLLQWYNN